MVHTEACGSELKAKWTQVKNEMRDILQENIKYIQLVVPKKTHDVIIKMGNFLSLRFFAFTWKQCR